MLNPVLLTGACAVGFIFTSLLVGSILIVFREVSIPTTPDQVEAAAYYRLWTYFDPNETVIYFEIGKKVAMLKKPAFFVLEGGYVGEKVGLDIDSFLRGYEENL